jgi:hypothetical protein
MPPRPPATSNVVVVGWNDTTAAVSSVTDESGNKYALARGAQNLTTPIAWPASLTTTRSAAVMCASATFGASYLSSYSDSRLKHRENYCNQMMKRLDLGEHSFVVEVASNDCYLSQYLIQ